MTGHIGARHREKTDSRTGERNGSYSRNLITPVGEIEQLRVPRDREGAFTTEVFEQYHRSTGEVEDAVLEMWLQGISQRKIAEITQKLGAVRIGKDAVSRIARRLDSELSKVSRRDFARVGIPQPPPGDGLPVSLLGRHLFKSQLGRTNHGDFAEAMSGTWHL